MFREDEWIEQKAKEEDGADVTVGMKPVRRGHIEYGQTSYASTITALTELDGMLLKFKTGLMQTQPRIKCTLRIEIESGGEE